MNKRLSLVTSLLVLASLACNLALQTVEAPETGQVDSQSAASSAESSSAAPEATPTSLPPLAQQPRLEPINVGPDLEDFPAGYSPLTGLPVSDPSALDLPVVLISITNFPITARPQAGLSYAPVVYEMTITQGMTRFLVAFYGEYPRPGSFATGSCEPRKETFSPGPTSLGNRAWEDGNANGQQDAWEPGLPGVCVDLLDAASGAVLQSTATDSNGYYGFDVEEGGQYILQFSPPEGAAFTTAHVGNDDQDSDADPFSGQTDAITASGNDSSWDAGFTLPGDYVSPSLPSTAQIIPGGEVGPVRSARDSYVHISGFFQDSCLIYASADANVLAKVPKCAMQFGKEDGSVNSAMLDITRMRRIAEESKNPGYDFNYAANLFSDTPPAGGLPANRLDVFYSYFNQQRWVFDPLSSTYLRFEDLAEGNPAAGEIPFVPSTDRLTGQQLAFENIIVLYANHNVISPTRVDIDLSIGQKGNAMLFRDGQAYKIRWSTVAGEYEQATGLRRPIRFYDESGNPIPLKPGQTWVHIVTPASGLFETDPGLWRLRFYAPAGTR